MSDFCQYLDAYYKIDKLIIKGEDCCYQLLNPRYFSDL